MASERLEKLLGFLKADPKSSFVRFAVAKEYESLGDEQQALDYYLNLTKDIPEYTGTYYHLGKLQERLGQYDQAIATYKQGMVICKEQGDKHAYSELAGAKLEIDDEDDF
ncbi:MAG: tetratricopeptide repeat protein [Bacteroidota bacterium]